MWRPNLQGLVICDVSDPDNPWIIDDVKGGGGKNITATRWTFSGTRSMWRTDPDGMLVVDVADTNNAFLAGMMSTVESTGKDVQVAGDFHYVCNSSGVNVVDCRGCSTISGRG
jgi:hypothetical protein